MSQADLTSGPIVEPGPLTTKSPLSVSLALGTVPGPQQVLCDCVLGELVREGTCPRVLEQSLCSSLAQLHFQQQAE